MTAGRLIFTYANLVVGVDGAKDNLGECLRLKGAVGDGANDLVLIANERHRLVTPKKDISTKFPGILPRTSRRQDV